MVNRVKQVVSALTAEITVADRKFVDENLSKCEQNLFWKMNLPDQRHALNVAYSALHMARNKTVNLTVLTKCALLHDVGKVKGDVSTLDKIITVMAHKLAPRWAKRWGKQGKGSKLANVRHAFYTYFNHPEISANLLKLIGTNPLIVDIVSKHHKAPAESDPPELVILKAADDLH